MSISGHDQEPIQLQELLSMFSLDLPPSLSLSDEVSVYGAVVSSQNELVCNGDFIQITPDDSEVSTIIVL